MVGVIQDRTEHFLKCRAARFGNSVGMGVHSREFSLEESLTSHAEDASHEGEVHLDVSRLEWMSLVDKTNYDIETIKDKIVELKKLHKAHLRAAGFDTDDEQGIEILTGEITRLFHECQRGVKHLSKMKVKTEEEAQMKVNIQKRLASVLQELSGEFRQKQKHYLERVQERNKKGVTFAFGTDREELEEAYDVGFTDKQMRILEDQEEQSAIRAREIKNIASSIVELAEIFNDMAILVADQGTILDRIDYNIEEVSYNVEGGVVEIEQAHKYQKKAGTKLLIILLLVAIIGVIIAIIVKFFATAYV